MPKNKVITITVDMEQKCPTSWKKLINTLTEVIIFFFNMRGMEVTVAVEEEKYEV